MLLRYLSREIGWSSGLAGANFRGSFSCDRWCRVTVGCPFGVQRPHLSSAMAENILPQYATPMFRPSTPKRIRKYAGSSATSPLADVTNSNFELHSRLIKSEQVVKPMKKYTRGPVLQDKVAVQASVYSFMWTLAVIKRVKAQAEEERRRSQADREELSSRLQSAEDKVTSLKSEKGVHKRQIQKLEEDFRQLDSRTKDEAATLQRELAQVLEDLARTRAERDQAAAHRAAAQAEADEQRAARLDGMRHHQAELALLSQQHAAQLAAATVRADNLSEKLANAEQKLQELIQRSARKGLLSWLVSLFW